MAELGVAQSPQILAQNHPVAVAGGAGSVSLTRLTACTASGENSHVREQYRVLDRTVLRQRDVLRSASATTALCLQ